MPKAWAFADTLSPVKGDKFLQSIPVFFLQSKNQTVVALLTLFKMGPFTAANKKETSFRNKKENLKKKDLTNV